MKSLTQLFLLIAILIAIVTPGTYSWAADSTDSSQKKGAEVSAESGGAKADPMNNDGVEALRKQAEDAKNAEARAKAETAEALRRAEAAEARANAEANKKAPAKRMAEPKAARPRVKPAAKTAEPKRAESKDGSVKVSMDGKGMSPKEAQAFLKGLGTPVTAGIYSDGKGNTQAKAIFARVRSSAPTTTPAPQKGLTEGDKVTISVIAGVILIILLLAIIFM